MVSPFIMGSHSTEESLPAKETRGGNETKTMACNSLQLILIQLMNPTGKAAKPALRGNCSYGNLLNVIDFHLFHMVDSEVSIQKRFPETLVCLTRLAIQFLQPVSVIMGLQIQ